MRARTHIYGRRRRVGGGHARAHTYALSPYIQYGSLSLSRWCARERFLSPPHMHSYHRVSKSLSMSACLSDCVSVCVCVCVYVYVCVCVYVYVYVYVCICVCVCSSSLSLPLSPSPSLSHTLRSHHWVSTGPQTLPFAVSPSIRTSVTPFPSVRLCVCVHTRACVCAFVCIRGSVCEHVYVRVRGPD